MNSTKAYVVTHTEPGSDVERIIESIKSTEGVTDVCRVVGRANILIAVEGRDLKHISDIITQRICGVRGISATETMVCVESGSMHEAPVEKTPATTTEQYPTPTIAFS